MEIIQKYPHLAFQDTGWFLWSPKTETICYDAVRLTENEGKLALLHEISHAELEHRIYRYDIELFQMEINAWHHTRELCERFNVAINEYYIAQCLQSYDEWLEKRSSCPACHAFGLQIGRDKYRCLECEAKWNVNWRKDRRVVRYTCA